MLFAGLSPDFFRLGNAASALDWATKAKDLSGCKRDFLHVDLLQLGPGADKYEVQFGADRILGKILMSPVNFQFVAKEGQQETQLIKHLRCNRVLDTLVAPPAYHVRGVVLEVLTVSGADVQYGHSKDMPYQVVMHFVLDLVESAAQGGMTKRHVVVSMSAQDLMITE